MRVWPQRMRDCLPSSPASKQKFIWPQTQMLNVTASNQIKIWQPMSGLLCPLRAGEAVPAQLLRGLAQPSATARLLAGLAVMHWARAAEAAALVPSAIAAEAAPVPARVVEAVFAALAVPGTPSPNRTLIHR